MSKQGRARPGTSHTTGSRSPLEPAPATAEAAPSASSSQGGISVSTLMRALQQENDSLRSQLLQSQQSTSHLSRQLEDALTALKEASEAQKQGPLRDTVSALQKRCHTLAERLLTVVQGRQSSQSAEVLFLLRSQQEERLFLTEALEDMLAELRGCTRAAVRAQSMDASALAQVEALHSAAGGAAAGEKDQEGLVGLHAGTVYRLMTLVADEMLQQRAQRKLDGARARMALEHLKDVLADVQEAVERGTRSVFQCWSALAAHAAAMTEAEAELLSHSQAAGRTSWGSSSRLSGVSAGLPPRASHPTAGASSLHTPLPYHRRGQGPLRHVRGSTQRQQQKQQEQRRTWATQGRGRDSFGDEAHRTDDGENDIDEEDGFDDMEEDAVSEPSFLTGASADPALWLPALEEELSWACDVLKACYRGLSDAQQCTHEGCVALAAVTAYGSSTAPARPRGTTTAGRRRDGGVGEDGAANNASVLAPISAISEEAERLLDSFRADLALLANKAAYQQEGLARRLSVEMQQQYLSARQHEERVQALEAENARLTSTWNRLQTELETRAAAAVTQRNGDAEAAVTAALLSQSAGGSSPPVVTPERFATTTAATTRPSAVARFAGGLASRGSPLPYANEAQHVYADTREPKRSDPTVSDSARRALHYDEAEAAAERTKDDRAAHAHVARDGASRSMPQEPPSQRARPKATPQQRQQQEKQQPPHRRHTGAYTEEASLSSLTVPRPHTHDEDETALTDSLSETTADLWVEESPKQAAPRRATRPAAAPAQAAAHTPPHRFRASDTSAPRGESLDATSPYRSERVAAPPRSRPHTQVQTQQQQQPRQRATPRARDARDAPVSSPRHSPRGDAPLSLSTTPPARRTPVPKLPTASSPDQVVAEVRYVPPRSAAVDQLWHSLSQPSRARPLSPTEGRRASPRHAAVRVSPSGLVSPRRERITSPRRETREKDSDPDTPKAWRAVRGSLMSSPARD